MSNEERKIPQVSDFEATVLDDDTQPLGMAGECGQRSDNQTDTTCRHENAVRKQGRKTPKWHVATAAGAGILLGSVPALFAGSDAASDDEAAIVFDDDDVDDAGEDFDFSDIEAQNEFAAADTVDYATAADATIADTAAVAADDLAAADTVEAEIAADTAAADSRLWTDGVVAVATGVSDDMSFGEAFATARQEVGAGGVFEWHGNAYNTYYAEEWNSMTANDRNEYFSHLNLNAEPVDDADYHEETVLPDDNFADDGAADANYTAPIPDDSTSFGDDLGMPDYVNDADTTDYDGFA